ncbi:ATP-binding protein [Candidatus Pacearchaeota archaeon]|nr:ATP-binding protein [Candidatus Pacearchaeota archaeon]
MIKDTLITQKQELEKKLKEQFIERNVDLKKLKTPLIKVIVGPRRAGKSFFALHFLNKMEKFGYVNFDDERLADTENYDTIVEAMNSIYGHPKYVLFDEIQNLAKWELFVNRLQRQGHDITITGSNSKLLSKELATHLTGRHFLINIFPFSFKEYLEIEKKELTSYQIREKLYNYLIHGGYPEPLIKNMDYKDYLSTLFNSIVYKDIVRRYKVRFTQGIEDLAFYLMSNIAEEYSFNTLAKMTKVKSVHTIEKYLSYFEEAFVFFSLKKFSYKIKDQITSNKKIYCIDNGFVHAKAFKLSPDLGKLYENLVACRLKKEELDNKISVFYWKNQQQEEVDFVLKKGTKVTQLIQVCFNIKDYKTKNREVRAIIKASKELKCYNLIIINEDYEAEEEAEWFDDKAKIKFIPLWKWLLE